MNDPKTTITGVVTGIISLLGFFHILLPPWAAPLAISIGVTLIGILAKDAAPTGNSGRASLFAILLLVVSLLFAGWMFSGCAGSAANTAVTAIQVTDSTINAVAAELQNLCQSGKISSADCAKIQTVYNEVQTANATLVNAEEAAINAGTDPTSGPDYQAALTSFNSAVSDLMSLATQLGVLKTSTASTSTGGTK